MFILRPLAGQPSVSMSANAREYIVQRLLGELEPKSERPRFSGTERAKRFVCGMVWAWRREGGLSAMIVSWTWTRGRDLHTDDLLAACGCAVDYYCYKVLAWYARANVVPQRAGLVERPTCRRGEPDKCHITIVYHLDVWEPLFSLNCNAMSPVGRVRIRLKFCSGDTWKLEVGGVGGLEPCRAHTTCMCLCAESVWPTFHSSCFGMVVLSRSVFSLVSRLSALNVIHDIHTQSIRIPFNVNKNEFSS